MKLVDEKGRLFGKVNLIDLLALVVVLAALAFAAFKVLGGGGNPLDSSTKLTYTAKVLSVEDSVYQEVLRQMEAAGGQDQLMADGALVDGFVTDVTATPHVNYTATDNGLVVRSEEDPAQGGRWDVVFTVEANVPDPVTSKVGTQEVRVGKSHILKTSHFEFASSTILTCQWG